MKISKAILITFVFILSLNILIVMFALSFELMGFNAPNNLHFIGLLGKLTLSFLFFAYFRKINLINNTQFGSIKHNINDYIFLLTIAVGLVIATRPFNDIIYIIDRLLSYDNPIILNDFEGYNMGLLYYSITALIVAPIIEELIFRKYILGGLLTRYKPRLSIIISSVCFSIIHLEAPLLLLPTFFIGLFAGFIYLKTKMISYVILLHFFYNLIIVSLNIFGKFYYQSIYNTGFNFGYWMFVIMGLLLSFYGLKALTKINFLAIIAKETPA